MLGPGYTCYEPQSKRKIVTSDLKCVIDVFPGLRVNADGYETVVPSFARDASDNLPRAVETADDLVVWAYPAGPKTKSNGELTLCHSLLLVDAAGRRALHGSTILREVPPELKEQMQAKLIEDGLLRVGGSVAAITEQASSWRTPPTSCAP